MLLLLKLPRKLILLKKNSIFVFPFSPHFSLAGGGGWLIFRNSFVNNIHLSLCPSNFLMSLFTVSPLQYTTMSSTGRFRDVMRAGSAEDVFSLPRQPPDTSSSQTPVHHRHWFNTDTGSTQALVQHRHWFNTDTGPTQTLVQHRHWFNTDTGSTQTLVQHRHWFNTNTTSTQTLAQDTDTWFYELKIVFIFMICSSCE